MEYLVFDSKNIAKRWNRVKEFINGCKEEDFWGDIKARLRVLLKEMIEIGIEEEIEMYIGSERYKHMSNRIDYRNGYYYRNLDTELGSIDGIKVARSRSGLFRTKIFDRYSRRHCR